MKPASIATFVGGSVAAFGVLYGSDRLLKGADADRYAEDLATNTAWRGDEKNLREQRAALQQKIETTVFNSPEYRDLREQIDDIDMKLWTDFSKAPGHGFLGSLSLEGHDEPLVRPQGFMATALTTGALLAAGTGVALLGRNAPLVGLGAGLAAGAVVGGSLVGHAHLDQLRQDMNS